MFKTPSEPRRCPACWNPFQIPNAPIPHRTSAIRFPTSHSLTLPALLPFSPVKNPLLHFLLLSPTYYTHLHFQHPSSLESAVDIFVLNSFFVGVPVSIFWIFPDLSQPHTSLVSFFLFVSLHLNCLFPFFFLPFAVLPTLCNPILERGVMHNGSGYLASL